MKTGRTAAIILVLGLLAACPAQAQARDVRVAVSTPLPGMAPSKAFTQRPQAAGPRPQTAAGGKPLRDKPPALLLASMSRPQAPPAVGRYPALRVQVAQPPGRAKETGKTQAKRHVAPPSSRVRAASPAARPLPAPAPPPKGKALHEKGLAYRQGVRAETARGQSLGLDDPRWTRFRLEQDPDKGTGTFIDYLTSPSKSESFISSSFSGHNRFYSGSRFGEYTNKEDLTPSVTFTISSTQTLSISVAYTHEMRDDLVAHVVDMGLAWSF